MERRLPLPLLLAALSLVPLIAAGRSTNSDGHPGFDGIWNSATATPLERPRQLKDKAFFTPEEASEWERQVAESNQEPSPEAAAKNTGTGTYNTVYREFGSRSVKTLRTSIVTDPPDGRIPALTPGAADIKRRRIDAMKNAASAQDTGLQDQCLAFVTAGPPMLPYSYNSNYQIVQTSDAFVVHAEMLHDTRIIPLAGRPHLPPDIRLWMGDSIGHWAGDTLVVDTTNFSIEGGFRGASANRHLVERFARLDRNTLRYEFTVDDPATWTRAWSASIPMTRTDELIYEYACHEGNYALEGVLKGARYQEKGR
jgi:hypothetical protein